MANNCACRRCVSEMDSGGSKVLNLFMKINFVCPICHDRACPSAEDHNEPCRKANIYAPQSMPQPPQGPAPAS